ncbi:hypothetical protein [Bradyrhizobium sp. SZCCHNS2002]|uniref:hypothetical protein n=1 Tax=Bradyrhizobium sp. SZCCHNS2002 TaxID=3057302 RepID=UPI0029165AB3|nr:hypothetical protein [Bradyrhizobium sp. SZCCHNS2002]
MLTTIPTVGFFKIRQEPSNVWTFTLTTLLGEWLHQAEEQFGPRDQTWTILGVEVGTSRPQIWYPGYPGRKHVAIQLSHHCQSNEAQARFELSQEIVHLLAPNGGGAALNIEEGVATLFANKVAPWPVTAASYVKALNHVQELLSVDPDAIKKLRKLRGRFQDFDPDFIKANVPVSDQLASDLCAVYAD